MNHCPKYFHARSNTKKLNDLSRYCLQLKIDNRALRLTVKSIYDTNISRNIEMYSNYSYKISIENAPPCKCTFKNGRFNNAVFDNYLSKKSFELKYTLNNDYPSYPFGYYRKENKNMKILGIKESDFFAYRGNMIMSRIESKALEIAGNAIKTRFTIPIKVNSSSIDYPIYIGLLKKIDKKFNKHVVESNGRKFVDGIFVINTNNGSYILVYGYPKFTTSQEDDAYIMYYLEMYLIGPNSLNILNKIKNYIHSIGDSRDNIGDITLYEISGDANGWSSIKSYVEKRGFDTLFFNGNIHEEIREHVDNWEKSAATFKERGLTHKTGILVHGKAGTGKSTLARALASELNYNLISIDTSTFDKINLIELTNAINNDDMKAIIFIDEIDAIFKSRDDNDTTDAQKARVNKLLTFLDGVNSPNNCIFLATTNYYNKLDAAIKRKGRFDKIIELTDINKDTAFKMCKSFGLSNESSKNIVDEYKKDEINPADLQDKIISVIRKELINE